MIGTSPPLVNRATVARISCLAFCLASTAAAGATELEGFTEPYRSIELAIDEAGTVQEVLVCEGDRVEAGQPLVRLNSDVHLALLKIAQQNMQAEGQLDAAEAELRLRQDRLGKLRVLRQQGHARQEEVDRALAEVAVAEANVRSAREERVTRELEYERIQTQIDRRTVRAPIAGIVVAVHKDLGEFVAPNDPHLLTLVQVDQLLANFTLMDSQASSLQLGQEVRVEFPPRQKVTGSVQFVSPVTDAQSGTVLVKLRISNASGQFRSGQRCKIRIED